MRKVKVDATLFSTPLTLTGLQFDGFSPGEECPMLDDEEREDEDCVMTTACAYYRETSKKCVHCKGFDINNGQWFCLCDFFV